jgi:hypothetical protein
LKKVLKGSSFFNGLNPKRKKPNTNFQFWDFWASQKIFRHARKFQNSKLVLNFFHLGLNSLKKEEPFKPFFKLY